MPSHGRDQALPLTPLTGNGYVPQFALRPGSYTAVRKIASAMPLYLCIYSFTNDYHRPLYASWDTLALTLGIGRAKVGRELGKLKAAALVFEVERGMDTGKARRVPARWAVDPWASKVWRERIDQALEAIAEEDGHPTRWVAKHAKRLDWFQMRTAKLANAIAEDMLVKPRQRSHKPKRQKRRKPKPAPDSLSAKMGLEVGVLPPERLDGEAVGEDGLHRGGDRENHALKTPQSRAAHDSDADPGQGESPTAAAA